MPESYRTIRAAAKDSFEEKKSEFIGCIAPVSSEEEAVAFINEVRAENRKARHNVYAYILREGNICRYSDDGEPQGTGGVPVLEVLKKEGLRDICVVVTRYFGGILLGTGGLTRAYSRACALAVKKARIMEISLGYKLTAQFEYPLYGKISQILAAKGIKLLGEDFGEAVTLHLLVRSEEIDSLTAELVDTANGRITLEKSTEIEADFS